MSEKNLDGRVATMVFGGIALTLWAIGAALSSSHKPASPQGGLDAITCQDGEKIVTEDADGIKTTDIVYDQPFLSPEQTVMLVEFCHSHDMKASFYARTEGGASICGQCKP